MPFGLAINTERAAALQATIQDELIKRGYCPDADPVMSDYITIMIINNKTPAQITAELEDLIGTDFDSSFTDWLFTEAAKGSPEAEATIQPAPSTSTPSTSAPAPAAPPQPPASSDSGRRPDAPPRSGIYKQAINQALPTHASGQKRTARSPSPNHPNKSRRTDLPTGPRAMFREGPPPPTRSLIDRVGPARAGSNFNQRDDIQARIDDITNASPDNALMMGGFPNGVDIAMANNMANPLLLQEMMMNQMALMMQMANTMGMNQGYPMQTVAPNDMGMYQGGMNGFPQQQGNQAGGMNGTGRGRGSGRGGRGGPNGRGRGGVPAHAHASRSDATKPEGTSEVSAPAAPAPIVAPTPVTTDPTPSSTPLLTTSVPPPNRTGYALPERPLSPTICKYGPKCTNPACRYSHPSPVSTPESGIVLSLDACVQGKDCKDEDCTKAHVSPAVLNPQAIEQLAKLAPAPAPAPSPSHTTQSPVPCRFGAACTRPDCAFSHPTRTHKSPASQSVPCRFGTGCTKAACPFQHPEGRVLPSTFHRGLSSTAPIVSVPTPETGSMGGPSHNRSVTFNSMNNGTKDRLSKQAKSAEDKQNEAKAAAVKKDGSEPVAITA